MIKKLLFILLSIYGVIPNAANATPWRQAGARLFHAGCTVAGAGLALGPAALQADANRKFRKNVDRVVYGGSGAMYNFPDRSDITPGNVYLSENSCAIEKELKRFGVEKPAMVELDESFLSPAMAFGNGVFGFTRDFVNNFDVRDSALVAHEVGHDVHRDSRWYSALYSLPAPVMFGLAKSVKKLTPRLYHRPFLQSILKLPAGIAIVGASFASRQLFLAYWEQRADRYAAEKCTGEELYGLSAFFRHHEALQKRVMELGYEKSALAIKNLEQSKSSKTVMLACIFKKIQPYLEAADDLMLRPLPYRLLRHHPTHLERAEYFEREAAKKEALEKAAEKNSKVQQ